MPRLSTASLSIAFILAAAAPVKVDDVVVTQFGAAFAGAPFAFMHANPKEAIRIGKYYDKVPPDVLERVTATLVQDKYWSEGRPERDRLDAMARGMKLAGELKGELDWARFANPSFLPKELQN